MHASHAPRPRRLTAVVPLALLVLILVAPAAQAQVAAGISGTVRNATTAEPVPDAPIRVTYLDEQGKVGAAKTTTDATGAFELVPPAAAAGYQVAVEHDGAEFRSSATELLPGQPSVVSVDVWDVTEDPSDVTVSDWVIWVDGDTETDGWAVQQDFAWLNDGDLAYVGGESGTVRVPLPPDAKNLQFLGTFLEHQGTVVDDVYVSTAPIVPGETTTTIRFVTEAVPTLTLPVTFEVGAFSLFVPMGLQAQGAGLRLAGTQSDQGITYQVYTVDTLTPGQELRVEFTEVGSGSSDGGDATTYLLIGIAAIALVAAIAFFVRGRRRARPAPAAGPRKTRPAQVQNPPKSRVATSPTNGHRASRPAVAGPAVASGEDDDDEVQLLIDEIAALDLSFEKGLIEERAYRRLRVSAKDRLLQAQEARTDEGSRR